MAALLRLDAGENAALLSGLRARLNASAGNPKKQRALRLAMQSIGKYPMVIHSGTQALALNGVGPTIARDIDHVLARMSAGSAPQLVPAPAASSVAPAAAAAGGGAAAAAAGASSQQPAPAAGRKRKKPAGMLERLKRAFQEAGGDGSTQPPADDAAMALICSDVAATCGCAAPECPACSCSRNDVRDFFTQKRSAAKKRQRSAAAAASAPGASSASADGGGASPQRQTSGPASVPSSPPPLRPAAAVDAAMYLPKAHSGNWAVLLALGRETARPGDGSGAAEFLFKQQIFDRCGDLSKHPFDVPARGGNASGRQYYSAWSSVNKKLITAKGYIQKRSIPAKLSLTAKGWLAVDALEALAGGCQSSGSCTCSTGARPRASAGVSASSSGRPSAPSRGGHAAAARVQAHRPASASASRAATASAPSGEGHRAILDFVRQAAASAGASAQAASWPLPAHTAQLPASLELIMLLDTREMGGNRKDPDKLKNELGKLNVNLQVRQLSVGDMLWIVRPRGSSDNSDVEFVVGAVVERKSAADLKSSHLDMRGKEQKKRLMECGLPHVTYCIEGTLSLESDGGKLETHLMHTLFQGIAVRRTASLADTAQYLASYTRYLEASFAATLSAGRLPSDDARALADACPMTYPEFQVRSEKDRNVTISTIFARQLLQLPSWGATRAEAVLKQYQTAAGLMDAYARLGDDEAAKRNLLKSIGTVKVDGSAGNKVGPAASKAAFDFFCATAYADEDD